MLGKKQETDSESLLSDFIPMKKDINKQIFFKNAIQSNRNKTKMRQITAKVDSLGELKQAAVLQDA